MKLILFLLTRWISGQSSKCPVNFYGQDVKQSCQQFEPARQFTTPLLVRHLYICWQFFVTRDDQTRIGLTY